MNITTFILSIAGSVAFAVLLLGWEVSDRWAFLSSRTQRRLQQAETPDQHCGSSLRLPANTLERKLVEANIGMNALQFRMASLGLGLAGTLISWFFLHPRSSAR